MNGAMVGAAMSDQVIGVVRAAVGAEHDVVHFEIESVSAAGDPTAVLVTLEHAAAHGRWNRRPRSNECYR